MLTTLAGRLEGAPQRVVIGMSERADSRDVLRHHCRMFTERIVEWGEATFREPATAGLIRTVEQDLGHRMPGELRELLAQTNGIEGEYGLGLLWSAERIARDNAHFRNSQEFRDLYMPFDGIVFFADAGNGDQFGVSLSGKHEVYVWNHEDDSRTWVASTILGYLENWMTGTLTV